MLSKILRGAVLATFAVVATVAQADVFTGSATRTLYWDGFDGGYEVPVNVTGYTNGRGGQFNGYFGVDGTVSGNGVDDFFRFFCIELGQYATGTATSYTRAALNPASAEARQLSWLFNGSDVPNGTSGFLPNYPKTGSFTSGPTSPYGKLTSNEWSGAMQLAVWEIMFETNENLSGIGLDLGDGSFSGGTSNSTAQGLAQAMLASAWSGFSSGNTAPSNSWEFYTFTSPSNQNYLAARYGQYDRDLPLPGTLALFGIGLAGLGLARRKG